VEAGVEGAGEALVLFEEDSREEGVFILVRLATGISGE